MFAALALSLAVSACSDREEREQVTAGAPGAAEPAAPADGDAGQPAAPATPAPSETAAPLPGTWDTVASGEGDGLLFLAGGETAARLHLFCPSGGGLLVNARSFRPAVGETRMRLGGGADALVLTANPAGDRNRGGVSGEASVPPRLADLLTSGVGMTVTYDGQRVGPLAPVPAAIADRFVTGCTD